MELVSLRPCTRNWNIDEPLELGGAIDPLKTEDAIDGRRGECSSQVDRFRLETSVDRGRFGSSTISDARDREVASFIGIGATGGNIYIEGVKGEGASLAGRAERSVYAEGVKGEGEGAIFSGRGGTGGTSTSRLFRGGTKTGPLSTTAAVRERFDLLDDRDLSLLDVTDPRRNSTVDSGVGGWDWDWDWDCI